ncbi:MAG TPA: hypothetical protein DCY89_01605 [Gammaproteobacteria bacterium]|nr:hypothetical protein [Gammaproteobacteria bacterium]
MGGLKRVRAEVLYRLPLLVFLLLILLSGLEGWRAWSALQVNDRIANAWRLADDPQPGDAPEWQLAHALGLVEAGRVEDALKLYQTVVARSELAREFTAMAWYNSGNIYLRQVMQEMEAGRHETAFARADRAKHAYRRALRMQPSHWDAKYNLETVMHLRPDLPPVGGGKEEKPGEKPEDAPPEIFGLPEGHP